MKKVILSAIVAAMVLNFAGCEESNDGYKERNQTQSEPDIDRPGDTKRYENFH